MLETLTALTLLASRADAKTNGDGAYEGLHAAAEAPMLSPPTFALTSDQQTHLDTGAGVSGYERSGRHELAMAAVTTRASKWHVWAMIQSVDRYVELLPLEWARLESTRDDDGRKLMEIRLKADIPMYKGELLLSGNFSPDDGYMAFHMTEDKGLPVSHAMGYWEVSEVGEQTLLALRLDFNANLPVPIPAEQWATLVGDGLQWFVVNLARTSENRSAESDRWLRDVE